MEQCFGHRVEGFCYPGGKHNSSIRRMVARAGFAYARTVENLRLERGHDRFKVPTSAQFFPHNRTTLWMNYVRYGRYLDRLPALTVAISSNDYWSFLRRLLEKNASSSRVLHIWGHSWEIERYSLWSQLEIFLAAAAALKPQAYSVSSLMGFSVAEQ